VSGHDDPGPRGSSEKGRYVENRNARRRMNAMLNYAPLSDNPFVSLPIGAA
jgi:hypothetical protein